MTVTLEIKNGKDVAKWLNQMSGIKKKRIYKRAGVRIGKELESYMEKITRTWDHPVQRKVESKATRKNMTVALTVDDAPFFWVTVGTPPHQITARRALMLAFPWDGPGSYVAKSTKQISSRTGSGRDVGPINFFYTVNNPGIRRPREFHVLMAKKILPFAVKIFKEEISAELARL